MTTSVPVSTAVRDLGLILDWQEEGDHYIVSKRHELWSLSDLTCILPTLRKICVLISCQASHADGLEHSSFIYNFIWQQVKSASSALVPSLTL